MFETLVGQNLVKKKLKKNENLRRNEKGKSQDVENMKRK